MLRMEIALIIILGFIAYMYFSTERKHTKLHRTFSVLLLVVIVHLVFDAVTIYTVNHLEQVPIAVNDAFHRVFVGTMAGVLYLFYRYIAAVVEEETKKKMIFDWPAKIFLIVLEIIALVFPIVYIQTPNGNYSAGAYVIASYGGVAIYLALCAGILIWNWKQIHVKKKFAIGVALWVEFLVCGLQGAYPTWLISGMGITLMTLSFYLTLENPDFLRAELTEQKMSMLYLKSQVNPHFLYNTLDTIRIQAQLNGDKKVADLLMRLQITDYILKPVNYEEFGSCIDRLKISLYNNEVKEKPVVKKERVITGITKYMQEHLSEDVSLHILSEEFHLNSQYISQLFKNEIGVNFLTYLTNIRMEHAKKLLLSSSLSIAEVSEQSGYGDYRVFTKVFKKSEGITPSQYRRDFLSQ